MLTVNARQVGQCPHGPVLTLRRVHHLHQPQDWFKASVVDVALCRQVPSLDGDHHSLQDLDSRRLLDGPRLRAVTGHVCQHAGCVIAHLKRPIFEQLVLKVTSLTLINGSWHPFIVGLFKYHYSKLICKINRLKGICSWNMGILPRPYQGSHSKSPSFILLLDCVRQNVSVRRIFFCSLSIE